jgi:hypothetical protein
MAVTAMVHPGIFGYGRVISGSADDKISNF